MKQSLSTARLVDFKVQYANNSHYKNLLSSIENLYSIFKQYPKPKHLTCFDGLRNDSDQIARQVLSYEVHSIPEELLKELEFFGSDESWGTTAEVKYLLPRMLEYIVINFIYACNPDTYSKAHRFAYLLDHGFCEHKLRNIKIWPEQERHALLEVIYALFEFLANSCDDLNEFIEDFSPNYSLDGERFIRIWENAPSERKKNQFRKFLNARTQPYMHGYEDFYIGKVNITEWIIEKEG